MISLRSHIFSLGGTVQEKRTAYSQRYNSDLSFKGAMMLVFAFVFVLIQTTYSNNLPRNDCFPKNWNHAWSRVGNTWFTFLKNRGNWHAMEKQCRAIEPGKTMLASPRTKDENSHLFSIMKNEKEANAWLGGVRLDFGDQFYWYRDNGKAITLEKIRTTEFWRATEPNGRLVHEDCIHMFNDGWWVDYLCTADLPAHCELRC